MGRTRVVFIILTLVWASAVFAENGGDTNPSAVGDEVVRIVREQFLDAERAEAWAGRHAGYAADIYDPATFASRTNAILAELETSHTRYYPQGSAGHRGLLAIFAEYLGVDTVEYEGIGIDADDRGFVKRVFAGGPAAKAGLLRGDRILSVNGEPYRPLDPFAGLADVTVDVTFHRSEDGASLALPVTPRRMNPMEEWLEAQRESARLVSREGVSVAYLPVLWCVGDEVTEWMRESIAVTYRDAQAMVLDFRDGWGGCNADFLNFFNTTPPVLTLVQRDGKRVTYDPQWRKPLYVLINGGSRSGKEVIAHALQRHGMATLVGQPTAGFVVGGRPFLLSDGSLLYLAVADALVDGERLEGVGASPDVAVPDGLEYAAGVDPQLERAIELAVERGRVDPSLSGLESRLAPGTLLVLGELHGTAEAPAFAGRVAKLAVEKGLSVTVALEIPRSESPGVERFVNSAGDASDRAALLSGAFWQSSNQDGRASEAMLGLLDDVRRLAVAGEPIRIVLFDKSGLGSPAREQAMADGIVAAVEVKPRDLTIVLTGNLHARLSGGGRISDPMAARVARRLPRTPLVSLNLSYSGGTSWISSGGGYGIHEFAGRRDEPPHVTIGDTLDRHGYHGVYHVGTIHASLPAVESRRVETRPKRTTAALEAPPDLGSRRTAAPEEPHESEQPDGDWPQWMGPHGDGVLEPGLLPRSASPSLEIAWRQPIGSGYSSISVAGDRAVTLEQDKGQVWAVAFDVDQGGVLWRVPLPNPERSEDDPPENPLSTPTVVGDRVFAIHPAGLLYALDAADGSHLWYHDLPDEFGAVPPSYGMSTSPLVVDGRLFVLAGGREGYNLIVFDPVTGERVASLGPASQGSYATPVAGLVGGKRQLVVPAANRLYAIGHEDGKPLWSHTGLPYPDRAPLLLNEDRVFVPFQEFGAMLQVTDSGEVRELWRSAQLANSYSPAVHQGGAIYGFGGPRLLCLDEATGRTRWQHRLGEGSLVRVDDHLIVSSSMGGRLTLVEANPDGYREKAALTVFPDGGSSFTPPSFGAGRIFLRGSREIAAIRPAP